MFREYVMAAIAGAFLLSMATAALAVTPDNIGKTIFIKDSKGNLDRAHTYYSKERAMPQGGPTPGDLLRQQLYEGGRIPKVVAPQWGGNP